MLILHLSPLVFLLALGHISEDCVQTALAHAKEQLITYMGLDSILSFVAF